MLISIKIVHSTIYITRDLFTLATTILLIHTLQFICLDLLSTYVRRIKKNNLNVYGIWNDTCTKYIYLYIYHTHTKFCLTQFVYISSDHNQIVHCKIKQTNNKLFSCIDSLFVHFLYTYYTWNDALIATAECWGIVAILF